MRLRAPGGHTEDYYFHPVSWQTYFETAMISSIAGISALMVALYNKVDVSTPLAILTIALGVANAAMPPVRGKVHEGKSTDAQVKSGYFTWVTYRIDQKKYEDIKADLLKPRPRAVYSMLFYNCMHFTAGLAKRHGLDFPGSPVYIDVPDYMAARFRFLPRTENRTVGHRYLKRTESFDITS